MVSASDIGRELASVVGTVEPGRLRRFRKTISGQGEARRQGVEVPPTYLFSLELLDAPSPMYFTEELGIDTASLLHAEEAFTYHAPVRVGDTLTFRTRVSDAYEKKGGRCSSSSRTVG